MTPAHGQIIEILTNTEHVILILILTWGMRKLVFIIDLLFYTDYSSISIAVRLLLLPYFFLWFIFSAILLYAALVLVNLYVHLYISEEKVGCDGSKNVT